MFAAFPGKRVGIIFVVAVLLQLAFLAETFINKGNVLLFQDPGLIGAYNIATFSTPHIQEGIVCKGFQVEGNKNFYNPAKNHQIQDTIGYPVLLGFLWKLTHTFSLYDIIIFQILVFSLLLVFFDQALVLLLKNKSIALSGTLGLMFFLPFIFFNVQPVKDVYLLYGMMIFFIAIADYFFGDSSGWKVAVWAIFFSWCQWVRSPLFGVLCMMTIALLLFFRLFNHHIKKIVQFLGIFWILNILVFWGPFIAFNKMTYGRYFASCSGQALISGLGEFENKWGFKLSDRWLDDYISAQDISMVGKYGTVEFDDIVKNIGLAAVKEDPFILIKNLMRRIPQILYYPFPVFSCFLNYNIFSQRPPLIKDRAIAIFKDLGFFKSILFVLSRFYANTVIFLGYVGFILLFKKREYAFLVLWISLYIGSLGLIISHIELRYIYPVMPLWGVLAGIFCYHAFLYSKKRWFLAAK